MRYRNFRRQNISTLIRHFCVSSVFIFLFIFAASLESQAASDQPLSFTDVTLAAGFDYEHGYLPGPDWENDWREMAGGVAAGDYDGDGWVDLYVVRGDIGPNLLFRNKGDGTFEEVGGPAGVGLDGKLHSGPIFGDIDGDGLLDLFVGGINFTPSFLFRNKGDGTFEDITAISGLNQVDLSVSASFGDYDRDGDLDLFIARWWGGRLFNNNGSGNFSDVTVAAGVSGSGDEWDLNGNFADINNDGWPDLLISGDFGSSRVFINNQDGTFSNATDSTVLTDENAMGAAIGDYDHDGDLDWFVSSIHDPNPETGTGKWGISGNRFYRNKGDGTFDDVTDASGVRNGFWGWASCFADFNNDRFLDLYHVNGFDSASSGNLVFLTDPARFFTANGDGTFTEQSTVLGVDHTGQGRGLVCFDYDRDGDLDLFIANNGQSPVLYQNNIGNTANFLNIKLQGFLPNRDAIGARIYLTAGDITQMREIRAGGNYVSQNPLETHFGLGSITSVDQVRVVWPDGVSTTLNNIAAGQFLSISDTAPSLAWPAGANEGVNPDNGTTATSFTFEVNYVDAQNRPPTLTQVWIDLNNDGGYSTGNTVLTKSIPPSSQVTFASNQLVLVKNIFLVGFIFVGMYRLFRSTSRKTSKFAWAEACMVVLLLFAFVGGCSSGGNTTVTDTGNDDDAGSGGLSQNERFAMTAVDVNDTDFSDGKVYRFTSTLDSASAGTINFLFKFAVGNRSATGSASIQQSLTINP